MSLLLLLLGNYAYLCNILQCCRSGSCRIRSFWVTRIRENTEAGSFIHKRTPVILIFSLYKIQFHQNNFLFGILSVIRCLGKKMILKTVSEDLEPNPDPKKMDQSRNTELYWIYRKIFSMIIDRELYKN